MIYLFMALRIEAQPWLREPGWKSLDTPFPSYQKDDILLTLTGTGPLSAASAVSSVLSTHALQPEDVLIQCGIAAGAAHAQPGECYLIHKITDFSSHRDYYPDRFLREVLPEASLITGSIPYDSGAADPDLSSLLPLDSNEPVLYDMEASGVMHAASAFLGPHQIVCVKIVSDTGELLTKETALPFTEALKPCVDRVIACLGSAQVSASVPKPDCHALAEQLHCSVTMERQLIQLLTYCELAGIQWKSIAEHFQNTGRIPVRTRSEGKQILEELRHELLR